MSGINRLLFTEDKVQECINYLKNQGIKTSWWFDHCQLVNDKLYYDSKLLVSQKDINGVLSTIYNDPSVTGGRDRIYSYVKEKYVGISRRAIMDFLRNQESYQLRFPVRKPKVTRPVFSSELNGHWEMDLIDMSKYNDSGYKWILVVVDVFSRYMWARALKNKEGISVKNALQDVFQERRPIILQSDNGKEFKNSEVRSLLDLFHIRQVFSKSYTPTTQGLVERFNGTLKDKIFNGFLRKGNKRWVNDLPAYVKNINHSLQSTVQEKPVVIQQNNKMINKQVEQRLIAQNFAQTSKTPVFNSGDHVRIALSALNRKNNLTKSLTKWTKQIYKISKVLNVSPNEPWNSKRYIVDGSIYNGYQLQKVDLAQLKLIPSVEIGTRTVRSVSNNNNEPRQPSTRIKKPVHRLVY